jgi:hypothetical protein
MATIMEQIQSKIKSVTGKSGYGVGFSGAGPSVVDRVKGVVNVVKTKGAMGTVQSMTKGEKPILSQVAPGMAKGQSGANFFKRLPSYKESPVHYEVPSTGRTEIRSRGN